MDSNPQRPRSPSLLDADAPPQRTANAQQRTLAEAGAEKPRPARARVRWITFAGLFALLSAAALLAWLRQPSDRPESATRAVSAPPTTLAVAEPPQEPEADGGAKPDGTAAIMPATDEAAAAASTPAPPPNADAQALSAIFNPMESRTEQASPSAKQTAQKTSPNARHAVLRKTSGSGDSDVALLAALLEHVEETSPAERAAIRKAADRQISADPVERRMQACPPANTVAGVRCRQRICAKYQGQTPACPTAAGD